MNINHVYSAKSGKYTSQVNIPWMFYFRSKNEAIITSVGSTIVIVAGEGISDKADVEIFSKIDDL